MSIFRDALIEASAAMCQRAALVLVLSAVGWLLGSASEAQAEDASAMVFSEEEVGGASPRPAVLVVFQARLPRTLRVSLLSAVEEAATVRSVGPVKRGQPPEIEDASLLVRVTLDKGPQRSRLLRLDYEDASHEGARAHRVSYLVMGGRLDAEARASIASEVRRMNALRAQRLELETLREAARSPREGEASLAPAADDKESAASREGGASSWQRFSFTVFAGFGMGTRAFRLAIDASVANLSTKYFAHALMGASIHYAPTSRPDVWSLGIEYGSSVGLRLDDLRLDGSKRSTEARSHHLDAEFRYAREPRVARQAPAADSPWHAWLGATMALGWAGNFFSVEAPIRLPNFTYSGLLLYPALLACLGTPRVRLEVGPTWMTVAQRSGALVQAGVRLPSWSFGFRANVAIAVHRAFSVALAYREAAAKFRGGQDTPRDRLRSLSLSLLYHP